MTSPSVVPGGSAVRFVLQAAIWGSSFTLISVAVRAVSPSLVVLSRLALAATVLLALAGWRHAALVRGRSLWLHTAVAAALGNVVPYVFLTYGERTTAAGTAGVLIGATPLLTLALGVVAVRDTPPSVHTLVGFGTAFAGLVLVIGPHGGGWAPSPGVLLCLGAAVSYAAGYVYVRRFLTRPGTCALGAAASQLVAALALQAALTPLLGWHIGVVHPDAAMALVLLGLLGTGYATVLYFRLIADLGAARAAAVDYLVPVFAVLFGVLVSGERLGASVIAGAVLILSGMAIGEGRVSFRRFAGGRCVDL